MILLFSFLFCMEETSYSLKRVRSLSIDLESVLEPSLNHFHSCQTNYLRTLGGDLTCFKIDYDLKVKACPDKTTVYMNYHLSSNLSDDIVFLYLKVYLQKFENHELYLCIYQIGSNFYLQKFVSGFIFNQIYPSICKIPKNIEYKSDFPVSYLGYFKDTEQANLFLNLCYDTFIVSDNVEEFTRAISKYIFQNVVENSVIEFLFDIKNMLLWAGNVDSIEICIFKPKVFVNSEYQELVEFVFWPEIDQSVSKNSILKRKDAYNNYFYFPKNIRLIMKNKTSCPLKEYFTFPLKDRTKVYLEQEAFNTKYDKLIVKWDDETIFNDSEVDLKEVRKTLNL